VEMFCILLLLDACRQWMTTVSLHACQVKALQKPCWTAIGIGTMIDCYFYLATIFMSFLPIPADSLTTSDKEEDDNDAKKPAAMHHS